MRSRGEAALLPPIPGMPFDVVELYEACIAEDPAGRPSSVETARRLAALAGVRVGAVDGTVRPSRSRGPVKGGTMLLPDPPTEAQSQLESPEPEPSGRRVSLRTALIGAAMAVAMAITVTAVVALGPARTRGTAEAAGGSSSPSSPAPALSCTVDYKVTSSWGSGATVALKITNNGDTDIHGWTVDFTLEGDVRAQSGWNGTWRQNGERVTVTAASHNADIRAGASVDGVGTNLDGKDAGNRIPDSFRLNGAPCRAT
jgi:hypothetical protein